MAPSRSITSSSATRAESGMLISSRRSWTVCLNQRRCASTVDAYIPAQGDTLNSLTSQFPGSEITPAALNFVPSPGGVTDVYIKPSLFRAILANDLPASQAAELAATQRPIAASALADVSGPPAWASIPSWAVIGTADHAIPPAAQEFMAHRAHAMVTEINASHLSLISQPGKIANVIEEAARQSS